MDFIQIVRLDRALSAQRNVANVQLQLLVLFVIEDISYQMISVWFVNRDLALRQVQEAFVLKSVEMEEIMDSMNVMMEIRIMVMGAAPNVLWKRVGLVVVVRLIKLIHASKEVVYQQQ